MSPATRRRFTLHLTPLLDLLFIVLYAQYIDLQEATKREISQATQRSHEAEQAEREAAKLRTDGRVEPTMTRFRDLAEQARAEGDVAEQKFDATNGEKNRHRIVRSAFPAP